MKKFTFMAVAMAAVLAMGVTSCNKNADEEAGYPSTELTATKALTVTTQDHDKTAAYAVKFDVKLDGSNLVVAGGTTNPNTDMYQYGLTENMPCTSGVMIASCGKASKIDKITEYPAASEFKTSVAAEEGYGYVVKTWGSSNLNAYGNANIHDPDTLYVRVVLSEAITGGFKAYYQFPFVPEK